MSLSSGLRSLQGLRSEFLELSWGFISCSSALIVAYCVVVVVTICSRTALPLVASDAMLSMILLNDSVKTSAGIAPGRGSWKRTLFVVGQNASLSHKIPWMSAAMFAEPKESAEGLEWQMTRLSTSCASWKWDFHFAQVRLSCGNPSNLGRSSGKLFSARREWYATATSHLSDIASLDRVAFRCASSQRVMNSGTCGSSNHQCQ